MEDYKRTIVPIIESNYRYFTIIEKNIADFFVRNIRNMDFSAKEIAKRLFVSEASLSRFAKKCGFSGYREFIYKYQEGFAEKKEPITDNTRIILNTYQELLNKTYSLVDENQIEKVVTYIEKAKRVFVCGKGSSGHSAREIELRFMRLGIDIDSVTDSDLMKMQGVFQDENSMVIGITISGATKEVIYFLKEAHKRGAKTVIITANRSKDFDVFCSDVILIPSLVHLNHGNVISPQFPILVMVDILYAGYVAKDKNVKILHADTLRALEQVQEKNNTIYQQEDKL